MQSAVRKPEAPPPAPSRMTLARVTRGKIASPPRIVLYGVDKIGKSTFGSQCPSPIFLCAEDGTKELDVARLPQPESWAEILEALDALAGGGHDYKTLVFDTLDWAEPLCWRHVCEAANVKTIEDVGGGYGKGYVAAQDQWRVLLARLDRLRQQGMTSLLIAHALVRPFRNPEGSDYERYVMQLNEKAAGIVRQWADAVLFANFEVLTSKEGKRVKGVHSDTRILHTRRHAAWDAGNRYDFPEELPLEWNAVAEAIEAHRPANPGVLRERIKEMLDEIADAQLSKNVSAAVAKAGDDAATLARYADNLAGRIKTKQVTEE